MDSEGSKKEFLYTVASVDRAIELLFVLNQPHATWESQN